MNTKLKSCESHMNLLKNGITFSLKPLQGLNFRNILIMPKQSKKYILTLKPIATRRKNAKNFKPAKHTKSITNVKVEASRPIAATPKLKIIDHKSKRRTSSTEVENFNLKLIKQPSTDIFRLSGGWRLDGLWKKNSGKDKAETNTNETHNNDKQMKKSEINDKDLVRATAKESLPNEVEKIESLDEFNSANDKIIKTPNQEHALAVNKNEILQKPTDHITTSFIETLLDETIPIVTKQISPFSASKSKPKNVIPPDTASNSTHTQCDLQNVTRTDGEICQRIERVEKQMLQLYTELKDLHKDLVPLNDLAKLNVLLKHFDEVNNLLMELKCNYFRVHEIVAQMRQKKCSSLSKDTKENSQEYLNSSTGYSHSEIYLGTCNCQIYKTPLSTLACREFDCNKLFQKEKITKQNSRKETPLAHNFYNDFTKGQHDSTEQLHQQDKLLPLQNETYPYNFYKREPAITLGVCQTKSENKKYHPTINVEHISLDITKQSSLSSITNTLTSCDDFITGCSAEDITLSTNNTPSHLPLLQTRNLSQAIYEIIGSISPNDVALTVFLESNNFYHINVSVMQTGQCLGWIYTTETAFKRAKERKLLEHFLIFTVLHADSTLEEREAILDYSFEWFIKKH